MDTTTNAAAASGAGTEVQSPVNAHPPRGAGVLKALIIGFAAVFALSAAGLIVIAFMKPRTPSAPGGILAPEENVQDLVIPPFALTNQHGKPVTDAAFKGRITIADFFFTHCPLICPMMTGTMSELTQELKDPLVQFMSFSIDPTHDTPERLREYAAGYPADHERWTFLTGDEGAIWRIVRDGLKFAIDRDTGQSVTLPDGTKMDNIRHPPHFVLIGPDGRVLGLYNSRNPEALQALRSRAREAAAILPH